MDAHALLTSQGWRGTGHTLHPTSDSTGLAHHLLIKREGSDGRGLGSRKDHKAEAWWMNAFDQALKNIDVTSKGGLKQGTSGMKLDLDRITARGAGKYTGSHGLYTSFVKGGMLSGTVEKKEKEQEDGGLLTPPESGIGTPMGASADGDVKESKGERKIRREAKKLKKTEKVARKEAEAKAAAKVAKKTAKEAMKSGETKEERKVRREARRTRKQETRRRKSSEG